MSYVVVVNNAADLALASRADKLFSVYRLVKANGLAARGADDLEEFLIVITIAAAITITATSILAIIAIAIAIAVVAIAITIAIVVAELVDEVFLNGAEILVKLVTVVVHVSNLILKVCDLCSHIVYKVNKRVDDLCLRGACIKLESVAKALNISSLFSKCHFISPFRRICGINF